LRHLCNSLRLKRKNGRIEYNETGRYIINDVSEVYYHKYFKEQKGDFVKITHLTSYQICNVYTNKNTPISAFLPLNGNRAVYKMVFDHKDTRLNTEHSQRVLDIVEDNVKYNCHGLTFLNRRFWLELDNETCETILKDDKFKECRLSELKEHGVALYYLPSGKLFHSGRIMNGNLVSKFGVNDVVTFGEEHIKKLYKTLDFSISRYFNP